MIIELFAVCELESAQVVAPQKPLCGATVCMKRKSICVHFDVRKIALFCVITHERATNLYILYVLIMCLNKVLSCWTHIICIMEKIRWARILGMCHYRILFYFRIHCQ